MKQPLTDPAWAGYCARRAGRPYLRALVRLLVLLSLTAAAFAQDPDQLERGRALFEAEAGGVGCAYCHGVDARGAGPSGVEAADIVGADASRVRSALGAVQLMQFISLSAAEIDAVVAYLQSLDAPRPAPATTATASTSETSAVPQSTASSKAPGEPPDGAPRAPAVGAGELLTINISITESSFEPAEVKIPLGAQIQFVIRNRTLVEHHYKVVGLEASDILWLSEPEGDIGEGVTDDEHAMHHSAEFVPWRAPSLTGIRPNSDEVHLWAYAYAPGGGKDVVRFTPLSVGIFEVVCPLHPDFRGRVEVYAPPL